MKEQKKPRLMMATKAVHPAAGDISREEFDFCLIDGEDGENFIGCWVTGLGFVGVRFPKETTRPLTPEEEVRASATTLCLNGRHIKGLADLL